MSTRSLILTGIVGVLCWGATAGCDSQRSEVDRLIGPQPSAPMSGEAQFVLILLFSAAVGYGVVLVLRTPFGGGVQKRLCGRCGARNRLVATRCYNCGVGFMPLPPLDRPRPDGGPEIPPPSDKARFPG